VISRATSLLLLLLLLPTLLIAQYGGRRGGATTTPRDTAPGPIVDPNAAGLAKAVAEQATPAQSEQFRNMTRFTVAARKRAADFRRLNFSPANSVEVSHQAKALQDAVDDARFVSRDFVGSFSDAQARGLKNLSKKLQRSEMALDKESQRFSKQLDQLPLNMPELSTAAGKIEKLLTTFQQDQAALGKEMGIATH
jgi:hypothetical protein